MRGGREGGREGRREGRREGGREEGREEGREGGREDAWTEGGLSEEANLQRGRAEGDMSLGVVETFRVKQGHVDLRVPVSVSLSAHAPL